MADLLSDGVIAKLRAGLKELPPGPWEMDHVRMDDAPDRHYEYELLDARGYRLCDTQNCDYHFGTIAFDYDEDGSTAWNEPARKLMEHIARCDPATIGALLDTIADLEARAASEYERGLREAAEVARTVAEWLWGSAQFEVAWFDLGSARLRDTQLGKKDTAIDIERAILAKIPSPTPAGETR